MHDRHFKYLKFIQHPHSLLIWLDVWNSFSFPFMYLIHVLSFELSEDDERHRRVPLKIAHDCCSIVLH